VVSFDQIKGRRLQRRLVEDQPLRHSDLVEPDLDIPLPRGALAVSVAVSRTSANEALRPGAHVDVVLMGAEKHEPTTIVRDALFLGLPVCVLGPCPDRVLCLALPPQDVLKVCLARAGGQVELVVRVPKNK
jgi:Flp pilus assembly protein CpaB